MTRFMFSSVFGIMTICSKCSEEVKENGFFLILRYLYAVFPFIVCTAESSEPNLDSYADVVPINYKNVINLFLTELS